MARCYIRDIFEPEPTVTAWLLNDSETAWCSQTAGQVIKEA